MSWWSFHIDREIAFDFDLARISAAHAIGLGGVGRCIYPLKERMAPVKSILNLPNNLIQFNLIPLGHLITDDAPTDKWQPETAH